MTINSFTILSERCTGSHFVQYAIIQNFGLKYINFEKHFFGHDEVNYDSTLCICVVRDAIEWVDSFFKRLHHVPPENKNIHNFLKEEWYSIHEQGPEINTEIIKDRHMVTKKRYKNILEMRKTKHDYLLNLKTTHLLILKYEDLRDNYISTLDSIKNKFNLTLINNRYEYIIRYKGTYTALYVKKSILLTDEDQLFIKQNIDEEQEKKLGYNYNYNSYHANKLNSLFY